MSQHLQRDLDLIKREILTVGAMVEESVDKAVVAVSQRRSDLAREVMAQDHIIDEREVQVEEECLKILALHQPVAADLRFIIAVMKVNNDLERIADHATDISERAITLSDEEPLVGRFDFASMGNMALEMVRNSLDALVRLDTGLATRVLQADNAVDQVHRGNFREIERLMKEDPATVHRAVQHLTVSRHLERIADLATNIAEDVIFMAQGRVVRHSHEDGENIDFDS